MSGLKKFVFCEGMDDVEVVRGLMAQLQLEVQVEPYLGKDNLSGFLRMALKRPEFAQQTVASVAILRDADDNAESAFASVRDALRQNNFVPPEATGIFSTSSPRVGVFIVGVGGKGMIEDLCLNSVADQPGFACVETYFQCVAQHSERKVFGSKSKVRVWMASHTDWEYHVGKAAAAGYWPWDSPAFDGLKQFLRAL